MNMNPLCDGLLFYILLISTYLCGITQAADGLNRKPSKRSPPSAASSPSSADYYASTSPEDDYEGDEEDYTDTSDDLLENNNNTTVPLDVRLISTSTSTQKTPPMSDDIIVITSTSKSPFRSSSSSFPMSTTVTPITGSSTSGWLSSSRKSVDQSSLPIDDDDATVTEGSGLTSFTLTGGDSTNRRPSYGDDFEGSGYAPTTIDPRAPPDTENGEDEDKEPDFEGSGTAPPVVPFNGGQLRYTVDPLVDNLNKKETPKVITEPTVIATKPMDPVIQGETNTIDGRDKPADGTDEESEIDPDLAMITPTDEPAIVERKSHSAQNLLAQPAMLAAVIGGAVIGLLCAILLVMYLVYRMRKKDEGSYALDEPTKRPGGYMRAPTNSGKEYYA